ncbi:cleavage and polyadenylation specificity factor subunit 1 [Caerostris extrusa]|uniref:Cleavage and polyadenylation specificity factor subunit 1 n=1 Tax=Caerostris extrusa TaxID=172846 RepID=A0AAV4QAR4_CAEEX|nr:cleavage and polyadenylation specificity factor subunit 1 [Caerostris extrusa]
MWTVVGQIDPENEENMPDMKDDSNEENNKQQSLPNSHAFLILSRTDSSMKSVPIRLASVFMTPSFDSTSRAAFYGFTKLSVICSPLISLTAGTFLFLQTGQEINELDHSGFSTQAPTVFAGNIGDNRFIVQISQMGVRLLYGSRQVQHIPLDVGSPIVWASVADPYVVIMSAEGLVIQLIFKPDEFGKEYRLSVSRHLSLLKLNLV